MEFVIKPNRVEMVNVTTDDDEGLYSPDQFRQFAAQVAETLANVNGREIMTVRANEVKRGDWFNGKKVHRVQMEFAAAIIYFYPAGYIQTSTIEPLDIERPIQ